MRLSSHFLLPVKYCPTPDSTEYQVDILYFLHIWLVTCRTRALYTICVIIYFSPLLSVCRWDVTDNQNQILVKHVRRNRHKRQAVSPARARGCGIKHFDRRTGVLRPPVVISASLRTTSSPLSNLRSSRRTIRNITRADLMLGRWPATNTCLFSGRTAYTVPSLALRRAGLPSCASQPKSDGHQLPCGGPLPEHGTTTLNSFESKQTTGYAAFGSRRS